jgi:hypothetical protein
MVLRAADATRPFGATLFAKNHSARFSSRLAAILVQGMVLRAADASFAAHLP